MMYVSKTSLFPQVLAIITFSLVAGFSVQTTVDTMCIQTNDTYNYTLKSSYSFGSFRESVESLRDGNLSRERSMKSLGDGGVQQSAQFFVTWGILTLFYCVIAILVYMLVTANERWEKAFDFLVVTVRNILCSLQTHV